MAVHNPSTTWGGGVTNRLRKMPQPVHNAIVTPHNDPHLCLKPQKTGSARPMSKANKSHRPQRNDSNTMSDNTHTVTSNIRTTIHSIFTVLPSYTCSGLPSSPPILHTSHVRPRHNPGNCTSSQRFPTLNREVLRDLLLLQPIA